VATRAVTGIGGYTAAMPREGGCLAMRRIWWPEPLYEARPYGALTVGLLAGAVALARALAVGYWEDFDTLAFVAGCAVMIYGAVVLQMRYDYRRRSRWKRQKDRRS
jgi:hypothetical protein